MHPQVPLFAVLSLLLAFPAPGQRVDALPRVASGTFAGQTGGMPPGPYPKTFQFWFHGSNLPPGATLHALSLRAHQSLPSAAYTITHAVTLSNTPVDASTLSTTLARNHGPTSVTVYPMATQQCPATPGGGSPDVGTCWIPFTQSFDFLGPHLLIEIRVTSYAPAGSTVSDSFVMQQADLHLASVITCGGSLSASYAAPTYTLRGSSVGANQPTVFLIGTEHVIGPFGRLPLALAPIGMPGCALGLDPFLQMPVFANASGSATLTVRHVPSTMASTVVYAQALHATTSNAAGVATTNTVHSVLGQVGLCDLIVSSDGVSADAGFPRGFNAAPVFLWR